MEILITGAGGTLGKAFINELRAKHQLIALDNAEWAVAELQKEYPEIEVILDDFSEWKYDQHPVDLVIHCAAYKHVELGQSNIDSFIDNNIFKTRKLFDEAYKHNTDILFISTDKAVEPISLYGYTKAIGELLCKQYNGTVARLGNILSSTGSVIPVWEKCIEQNIPLQVTHPDMQRYVIEAEEASKLIWDGYKKGKKLIVPDLPLVSIVDLAKQVLAKHNRTDLDIEYVGTRPGEKMVEKMRWEHE